MEQQRRAFWWHKPNCVYIWRANSLVSKSSKNKQIKTKKNWTKPWILHLSNTFSDDIRTHTQQYDWSRIYTTLFSLYCRRLHHLFLHRHCFLSLPRILHLHRCWTWKMLLCRKFYAASEKILIAEQATNTICRRLHCILSYACHASDV